ncbi:hypothetical protein QF037_009409 [Streptomyces canus]|uniref:substrate-binding domain-containing protein n=1 Tax=Streptomyces canus TaxID=58343 RepID=UPI002787A22D|nr:substrate-binding domain-containing protein [Streptomyces canus]MDQ0605064.1 hypothetical protein [Streptomyces canus]
MAVFADSNHQRLGINRAAASLGLRLPDGVCVVGFGDLPFVDWVTPRPATVRTPLADMTVRAACMVPRLLSGQQPETAQVEVTIELVVRDSSGPSPVTGRAVERSQGARAGSAEEGRAPGGTEWPTGRSLGQWRGTHRLLNPP